MQEGGGERGGEERGGERRGGEFYLVKIKRQALL